MYNNHFRTIDQEQKIRPKSRMSRQDFERIRSTFREEANIYGDIQQPKGNTLEYERLDRSDKLIDS